MPQTLISPLDLLDALSAAVEFDLHATGSPHKTDDPITFRELQFILGDARRTLIDKEAHA